jgi:hypothetical protein
MTVVTATADNGIWLTVYSRDGAIVSRIGLSWQQAALLGSDLTRLARS